MSLTRRQAVWAGLAALGSGGGAAPAITAQPWGRLADGRQVTLYTLVNRQGLRAEITDYGGIVVGLWVPDRHGRLDDVVLGFDALDRYLTDSPMFGAIIGRYANRIGEGRFSLDGRDYPLSRNAGGLHNIHGGPRGWDKALWRARPFEDRRGPALELSHFSPDGDQGFPGAVTVVATYRLAHDDRLSLEVSARTDAPTIINLTHHSYFNLSGDGASALDHDLQIAAAAYTVKDETGLPTGEIAPVSGTALDFRNTKAIGRDLASFPHGYDHNLVLDGGARTRLRRVARLSHQASGRALDVHTDQPGLQMYSAHWLDVVGKGGVKYGPAAGVCLEPQHFPDSPNHPNFPLTVLRPSEVFRWRSSLRFLTIPA